MFEKMPVWTAVSTRLGVMRWLVIACREGMPCWSNPPWLLAACSPDAAATVPSMGSLALSEEPLALSEEPLAREGSAVPVRGHPPTMSKLSYTKINRLLLFSCSEVAPPSLSAVRVLVGPAAPSPVEVGPSASSPGTETTAMEFPSVSAPVEVGAAGSSHQCVILRLAQPLSGVIDSAR